MHWNNSLDYVHKYYEPSIVPEKCHRDGDVVKRLWTILVGTGFNNPVTAFGWRWFGPSLKPTW
jgi:hypothetical protein